MAKEVITERPILEDFAMIGCSLILGAMMVLVVQNFVAPPSDGTCPVVVPVTKYSVPITNESCIADCSLSEWVMNNMTFQECKVYDYETMKFQGWAMPPSNITEYLRRCN